MHSACTIVEGCLVNWGYGERICTAVGTIHLYRRYLQDSGIEMESQTASDLLPGEALFISEPNRVRSTHKSNTFSRILGEK